MPECSHPHSLRKTAAMHRKCYPSNPDSIITNNALTLNVKVHQYLQACATQGMSCIEVQSLVRIAPRYLPHHHSTALWVFHFSTLIEMLFCLSTECIEPPYLQLLFSFSILNLARVSARDFDMVHHFGLFPYRASVAICSPYSQH